MIKYSFIIPVKQINNYIRETVPQILKIKRSDFEIIIFPDQASSETWPKTQQIPTSRIGPAQKRNLAIKYSRGQIFIFLDDDAYPQTDYLDILDKIFLNPNIIAAGGPAITPPSDSFWQKVSGAVFLSRLSGGCPERYAPFGQAKFVDDWPSVNLAVRQKAFEKVRGFNCQFWPGEDTKLCLDLLKLNQGKIIYEPSLIVWHHRRPGFLAHLKQISGYGLHRGFFAKKFPATSLKLKYFLPSLFLLFIIIGAILSWFSQIFFKLYLIGWLFYGLALAKAFWDIKKHEPNILVILNSIYYIFFSHLIYGLKFIQGFIFVKNLKSKLR